MVKIPDSVNIGPYNYTVAALLASCTVHVHTNGEKAATSPIGQGCLLRLATRATGTAY
jgi:hypothetical protein